MSMMFIELAEQTNDEMLKIQLLNDMVAAEYLYYGLKEDTRYINAVTLYIRRFAEKYCDILMEKEGIDSKNPNTKCEKYKLYEKIDFLYKGKHINDEINKNLHQIRKLGNQGAHNYISTESTTTDDITVMKITKNEILQSIENAFDAYKFYYNKYLKGNLDEKYRFLNAKLQDSYPYNKHLKEKFEKEFEEDLEIAKLELEELKVKQKAELEEAEKQLKVIEGIYEESIMTKEKEIAALQKEHEEKIEALKSLHSEDSKKFQKEKERLEKILEKEEKKVNAEYEKELKSLEDKMKNLNKIIKNLAIGIGAIIGGIILSKLGRKK